MMKSSTTFGGALIDTIAGIAHDFRTLVHQEMQLVRDEVKLEIGRLVRVTAGLSIGIALLLFGLGFVLVTVVYGIHEWTAWPLWVCYGIVAFLLIAIGTYLVTKAARTATSLHAVPARSLRVLKENAQWIKEHVLSSKT
jgi:hypothetical protein